MLFFAFLLAVATASDVFNVVFQNSPEGCCKNNNNNHHGNQVCSHWNGIAPKTSGFFDRLLCNNGETCSNRNDAVWDCCNNRGGRAACPNSHPFMCAGEKNCGGADWCCSPECALENNRPLLSCGNTPQPLDIIYYTRNNGATCPMSRNGCVSVQAGIDAMWATCGWADMTTVNRLTWNAAFGYNEANYGGPSSYTPTVRNKTPESSKVWNALTAEQRAAAVCLGYGQATWDAAI
eukprot:NODE_3932_length_871_cov_220.095430_g3777_i0.p2 GENE.NODE_3932_length_871_cov_220.095430_g3777_i0~~NODE_3932_length_871_cov_220.095430_g3777_i0.p2  ORF type:complete len:235 (+),score=42.12 NODE_3932_length_871_cov_220.095430_g3777_i0:58-762(+)